MNIFFIKKIIYFLSKDNINSDTLNDSDNTLLHEGEETLNNKNNIDSNNRILNNENDIVSNEEILNKNNYKNLIYEESRNKILIKYFKSNFANMASKNLFALTRDLWYMIRNENLGIYLKSQYELFAASQILTYKFRNVLEH